jgi:glycosyltransferase involved in cell wall biosynthesis
VAVARRPGAGLSRRPRFLLATAEAHPTHRSDVRVLFGKSLPECGIDVDLLAVIEGDAPAPAWPAGRGIHLRARSRPAFILADLWQQLSLFWLCLRGYDGLVVRDKPILGLIGYLAARLAGIPYCYWMSFPLPEAYLGLSRRSDGGIGRLRRAHLWLRGTLGGLIVHRILMRRADWLFVQSVVMERELRAKGLDHDRVTPVPMGVDVDAMPPACEDLPEALKGRRLGVYLGTLDRSRRPELLVETALQVAKRQPDFTLMVIGEADEPSDRGWLRRHAEAAGALPWMHFTGQVPYATGIGLARRAEVGLSPFLRSELLESASPTKAVEYLACGLPVVCNDQPDQEWVVRQSGGGLIAPLSAEGFADAVLRILEAPRSFAERAEGARAWVAQTRSYRVLGAMVADRLHRIAGRGGLRPDAGAETGR